MTKHDAPTVERAARYADLIESTWPSPEWTDGQRDNWRLFLLHYDDAECRVVFVTLQQTFTRRPLPADWHTAALGFRAARARRLSEQIDEPIEPVTDEGRAAQARMVRMLRDAVASMPRPEHRHHAPPGEYRSAQERWDAATAACPICGANPRHDHRDKRVFGYTKRTHVGPERKDGSHGRVDLGQPVEAWEFTCPHRLPNEMLCGDAEVAALKCDTWTPDGAAFRRANAHLFNENR
jgi:hypothetical protein